MTGTRDTPFPVFDWLIGQYNRNEFLSSIWEKSVAIIDHDAGDSFQRLLTVDDVDHLISWGNLRDSDVRMSRLDEPISSTSYIGPTGYVDKAGVQSALSEGATLITQRMHVRVPALGKLCRDLEKELSISFQANAYLTPAHGAGFAPHFDTHDVFIMQVEGTKDWEICGHPMVLPLRGQAQAPSTDNDIEVTQTFTLSAGQIAYIPRGIVHRGRAGPEASLHITLGALPFTYGDVLLDVVSAAYLDDVDLRRCVPLGFARTDLQTEPPIEELHRQLLKMADSALIKAAWTQLIEEAVNRPLYQSQGRISAVVGEPEIELSTNLKLRDSLLYTLRSDESEVLIRSHGKELVFPISCQAPLEHVLTGEFFSPETLLGDLDDAGRLTLVRRLRKEGFLDVVVTCSD